MNKNYNNMLKRTLSGIVGSIIILFSTYFSAWSFFVTFFIIHLISLYEFYQINACIKKSPYLFIFSILTGLFIYVLSFFIEKQIISYNYYFVIFIFFLIFYVIKLYRKELNPFDKVGIAFLGIAYVSVPFALFNTIALHNGVYNSELVAAIILLVWVSDIGAYLIGKYFGHKKLFSSVSPNKTWEGTIGGFIFAISTGFIISQYIISYSIFQWIFIALIISISGVYGDLIESLLKRSKEIKDSSKMIPGHGGFLDRFDSFLFASPIITAFLKITL